MMAIATIQAGGGGPSGLSRLCEDYFIGAPLGAGGMGLVYEGRKRGSFDPLAIKLFPRHASGAQRALFEEELRIARLFDHPRICPILDHGVADEGSPFIVMPLLRGSSLASACASAEPPPLPFVRDTALAVLEGLEVIHGIGIAHRDIKPSNIFLPGGRPERAVILDFGISKREESFLDAASPRLIMGSAAYMAPEQLRGEVVDRRADLFALGVVLFELATGHRPFLPHLPRDLRERLARSTRFLAPSVLNPKMTVGMERAIVKALSYQPKERFDSASEMRAALGPGRSEKRCLERPRSLTSELTADDLKRPDPPLRAFPGAQR